MTELKLNDFTIRIDQFSDSNKVDIRIAASRARSFGNNYEIEFYPREFEMLCDFLVSWQKRSLKEDSK